MEIEEGGMHDDGVRSYRDVDPCCAVLLTKRL
jgi:hypothetical protein